VRTFWILLVLVAALSLILLLRAKSSAFRESWELACFFDCCLFDCCTIGSLFVICVVALWGGALAAVRWQLSVVRS
jgi:hypothetical protein